MGDEGGFAPPVTGADQSLKLIDAAIKKAGHDGKVYIGMDCAASEFFVDGMYDLNFKQKNNDGSGKKSGAEMLELYKKYCSEYPIISIEDPYQEDDWENTAIITKENLCQIVGDDLLVTNPKRIAAAIEQKACNALLLKVNQIGTLSEAIEAVRMSKGAGWGVMTSHRSGETEDSFIADLAVGLATG